MLRITQMGPLGGCVLSDSEHELLNEVSPRQEIEKWFWCAVQDPGAELCKTSKGKVNCLFREKESEDK